MSQVWESLQATYNLTDDQLHQMRWYYYAMMEWNQYVNLTAITHESDVVAYHLADACEVTRHYPIAHSSGIIDVGTGAGVPGIPLKILYPHLPIVLVEVIHKKVQFLEHVICKLRLNRIEVSDYDWRTFLRKTNHHADIVTARASLQPDELIRMFKPSSPYKDATCIYWASHAWQPSKKSASYITNTIPYSVANRDRQYVLFRAQ